MDELIELLRQLPKRHLACQGGVLASPRAVSGADGVLLRPRFALWTTGADKKVTIGKVLCPGDDPFEAMLETLGGVVENRMDNRACPRRLVVGDPELAEYLRSKLKGTGIEVQFTDQLPSLETSAGEMANRIDLSVDTRPGLLDAPGMDIERVRAFAAAANAFHLAAPWHLLSELDLIQIESPQPPQGMAWLFVMGATQPMYGLQSFPSRVAYKSFLPGGDGVERTAGVIAGMTRVSFVPVEELAGADGELWTNYQLPIAGERAYPLISKDRTGMRDFAPPSESELTFWEGVLWALATTNEEEIDSGRWHKKIMTFDGPVVVTLAIPDLLKPPSPEEWVRRTLVPDPRAHEWVYVYGPRYLAAHPPVAGSEIDENELIERLTVARVHNDPLTRPRSPAEQAQDLCFTAFATPGRRRVQLARQALELDPACADAHVILAEKAGPLEDQLEHYHHGLDAAERMLGSSYFTEPRGRFWKDWKTRPYMRARFGIAESLAATGRVDEAILHYQELLRLNPNDDQSVRYILLPKLLATGRDVEAAQLLKQFAEKSANWAYCQALLAFRLSGSSAAADSELREALRTNSHVPELLCSAAPLLRPPFYTRGSLEEAYFVADQLRPVFEATPGALGWLAAARQRQELERDKRGREQRRKKRVQRKKRK